ncbi:ead/Ea22-like family protein [Enterobacteriaceae bacterium G50]|nr:ead/Ea22-like family protein [Enterobacteriaceae bacterium G50]
MSMTTELELAQRMKAAAIDANELSIIARYSKGRAAVEAFSALMTPNNVLALVEALEAAEKRIAELERMESALRPVGVMSQKAYRRLENRESRFIALWPRPEIYLPRKRPDDGVIVFARTAACVAVEGE